MISGQDATLNYYCHYMPLLVGGELMVVFESPLTPVVLSPIVMKAVVPGVNEQQIETFSLPVQANNHPIHNPSLDYPVYLSQPLFLILFQVPVLPIMVYAVESEIKLCTADEWLQAAGGDITTAVIGKLLSYTLILSLIGILDNFIMFGILYIPFQGSWLLLSGIMALFIIAIQALALFISSLFPAVAIIISIVSMAGSLGATLFGVTFLVLNIYPSVRDVSYLFPVRHYTETIQTMLYYDGGFIHLWPSTVILCTSPLLALAMPPHLRRAITSCKYENIR